MATLTARSFENSTGWTVDYSKPLGKLTDEEALLMISSKFGTADRGRDPTITAMHKSWFLSLTHLINQRFTNNRDILPDMDPNFSPRNSVYSANLIMRHVMTAISKLHGVAPKRRVTPMTTDRRDGFAAETAERILDYLDDVQQWDQIRNDFCFWLVVTGTGIIENQWDPAVGKLLSSLTNPFDGKPMGQEGLSADDMANFRQMGSLREERTGDLIKRAMSPFELTTPRGARDLKTTPWLCIEKEVDPGWIWERYPNRARGMRPDDNAANTENILWKRVSTLVNQWGFSLPTSGPETSEMITIREMWIPPSKWAPDGMKITATRDTLLEKTPHPFWAAGLDHRDPDFDTLRYPVSLATYVPVTGRIWGMGLVENLIGPQQVANTSTDQTIRQRDRLGSPVWLSPRGAELKSKGDVFEYRDNAVAPTLISPPPIGQPQIAASEMAQADMRLISSLSEASSGEASSGLRSASMMQAAAENDTVSQGPTLTSMTKVYRDVGVRDLSLYWKLVKQERLINITGDTMMGEAMMFKGDQLNGNVFVRIDPQSMKIRSQAAVTELVGMMTQMGMLNPQDPRQQELSMKVLQFQDADFLFKGMNLHRRRAAKEDEIFAEPQIDRTTGQQMPYPDVNDYDDHEEHMMCHREFMATDVFEKLPFLIKQAYMAHVRRHEEAIAIAVQAQQQMMAGPGGGSQPAPVGQASQPAQGTPQLQSQGIN